MSSPLVVKEVGKTSGVRAAGSAPQKGAPGELSHYDDGTFNFTGNGSVSALQVANRAVQLEADTGNEDAKRVQGFSAKSRSAKVNPDSANLLIASQILQNNPQLGVTDPTAALPNNQTVTFNLKSILSAPCFQNLEAVGKALEAMSNSQGPATPQKKAIGSVVSMGLSLPWDPNL